MEEKIEKINEIPSTPIAEPEVIKEPEQPKKNKKKAAQFKSEEQINPAPMVEEKKEEKIEVKQPELPKKVEEVAIPHEEKQSGIRPGYGAVVSTTNKRVIIRAYDGRVIEKKRSDCSASVGEIVKL